jgi:hypothetical protein
LGTNHQGESENLDANACEGEARSGRAGWKKRQGRQDNTPTSKQQQKSGNFHSSPGTRALLGSSQRAECYMTITIGLAMKVKRAMKVQRAVKFKTAMKIKAVTSSASKILMCLIETLRFTVCLGPRIVALATSPEGSNLPSQEAN